MEKKKEDIFKAFTAKAVQRLKDKKVTKYETLYVPSIDQNIKIRNLNYPEIVECTEIDDKQDPNASDNPNGGFHDRKHHRSGSSSHCRSSTRYWNCGFCTGSGIQYDFL